MSLRLIDTWKKEVEKMLPPFLRHQSNLDWMGSLVKPLESVQVTFDAFEIEIRKRLRYNGKIMVLQAALDEQFGDGSPPFIRIETNRDPGATPSFFYGVGDGIPTFFAYGVADGVANYITSDPNSSNTIPDFRVLIPIAIYTPTLENKVRVEVDLYKIAGKSYEVITY
jgi:hypothetical protein